MLKKTIKINIRCILYFLLLFPFIRVRTMEDFPIWIQEFYNYASLISCVLIFLYLLKKKIKFNNFKPIYPLIIFCVSYVFITGLNNFEYLKSCYNCVFFLAIAMFINEELRENAYNVLKSFAFIYVVLILLNNILVIFFPQGFYDTTVVTYHNGHLLGDDNAIIYVALPGMIILSIYSLLKNKKMSKFTWLNIILCELIFIKLWSVSAIISFGVFMILILAIKFIKISPIKMFILLLIFCIFVFVGFNLPFVMQFITNVLHKDITFSGRTYLWQNGWYLISKHPVLGYGGYFVSGRTYLGKRLYPVHTTHLQILIDGGIILFIQYLFIFLSSFAKMNKYKDNRISQIFCAGFVALVISYTFEQAGLYHFIILATLALNIDKIINCLEKEKNHDNDKRAVYT